MQLAGHETSKGEAGNQPSLFCAVGVNSKDFFLHLPVALPLRNPDHKLTTADPEAVGIYSTPSLLANAGCCSRAGPGGASAA